MIGSRQKELLKAIVSEYVKSARPVGSKSLCKKFKCSSATIRNDMAMLEDLGYLEKTHISSGRIPSELGYRYYVDNLMEPKKISGEDMLKLQTIFNNKDIELNDAISKSLEIISDMTNYTSVILGKESSDNKLQKVEVIPLNERELIAIVITDTGHVENKRVTLEDNIPIVEISKTTELLNKMLVGTPIDEVPSKLEFEIKPIIRNYIQNYEIVYNAFYNALSNFTSERDVKFTGKTIVKTKYKAGGREGTIAVIGPKRMEYERVVNMLEFLKEKIESKYNKQISLKGRVE